MNELDELFVKEFRQAMNERRCFPLQNRKITLQDIHIPAQGVVYVDGNEKVINIRRSIPKTKEYVLQNITEPYFDVLNYKNCKRSVSEVDRSKQLVRKKYDHENNILRDAQGKPRTEDVSVPHGSIAVISTTQIKKPTKAEVSKGFEYVDFQVFVNAQKQKMKKYIYIVPKENCYEVNFCALYITLNKMKRQSTFKTVCVTLSSGTVVYLQVVKYKIGESFNASSADLISVKTSSNFDNEIAAILNYWESTGIMFKREMTALQEPLILGNRGLSTMNVAIYQETNDVYYDAVNRNRSVADMERERKEAYSGDNLYQSYEN